MPGGIILRWEWGQEKSGTLCSSPVRPTLTVTAEPGRQNCTASLGRAALRAVAAVSSVTMASVGSKLAMNCPHNIPVSALGTTNWRSGVTETQNASAQTHKWNGGRNRPA